MAGLSGGGGGGGGSGIRAGRAFVELWLKDVGFNMSLANVQKRFERFGAGLMKVGGVAAGIGTAVLAPIAAIFNETIDHFDKINKANDRLGSSTEVVSALGYAAEQSGSSLEGLETGLRIMQKNLAGNSKAFKELGLNTEDLMGLPLDEQLETIAEAISGIDDPAQRAAMAMKIFGKSGASLLPLMMGGAEGIRALKKEAGDVGAVINGEQAQQATRFGDAIQKAMTGMKNMIRSVGTAFLPLIEYMETFANWTTLVSGSIREFIKENRMIVVTVAAVAAGLVAGGVALAGLGGAFMLIGSAIGGFLAVAAAIKVAFLAIISPIGLTVLAVAAMGAGLAYLFTLTSAGEGFFSELMNGFGELTSIIQDTFGGISDAMAAGDLALAGEIAMAGLKVAFASAVSWMTERWNKFKGFFVDGWHDAFKLIKIAFSDAWSFIELQVIDLGQFIQKNLGEAVTNVIKFILDKYIAVMDATNIMGMNDVQIALAQNLKNALNFTPGQADEERSNSERRRQDRENAIEKAAQAEQEARDKARLSGKGEADAELKAAQDKLNDLILNAAFDANAKRLEDEIKKAYGGGGGNLKKSLDSMATKGQFGGADAQLSLRFNDKSIQQKTLDATEEVAENTGEIASKLDDIEGGAFA